MPIYEFECLDCKLKFDELCSINTREIPCPKCQSINTKRLISMFGIGQGAGGGSHGHTGTKCTSCHGGHCSGCH
ncbi:MAG TPA: zinc ribbon domain-containing protein [Firmicutes bacterium]|jgi:putative FmdB family regulatory protein|nr:zinc ribbon domain-containing protein [Bacillota bacterium]